ncbi:hypothetical protein POVWA2_060240 [Plasmodium ovale wallikeri]|uniref:Uncharacterized protein n=1 Tax=Plasmodium ovale wallikeri TaxID=864142 RepID=A0A1A9A144_PLAOA|nr:hypothetical protein POVWA1_060900 [Plasmodium ovale wallikeri]SBT50453.1 hypothetical protein POVWA2_060240 [Plasmodium ovale wallikeri]
MYSYHLRHFKKRGQQIVCTHKKKHNWGCGKIPTHMRRHKKKHTQYGEMGEMGDVAKQQTGKGGEKVSVIKEPFKDSLLLGTGFLKMRNKLGWGEKRKRLYFTDSV